MEQLDAKEHEKEQAELRTLEARQQCGDAMATVADLRDSLKEQKVRPCAWRVNVGAALMPSCLCRDVDMVNSHHIGYSPAS